MLTGKGLATQIGLRFLRLNGGQRFSSFISLSAMLGIAIGISVLIVIMSAMNGFERELRQGLLSVVPHGEISMFNQPIDDWPGIVEQAKKIPGVIEGAPVISLSGLIINGNDLNAVQIDGILPRHEQKIMATARYIQPDAWQALSNNSGGIVLGQGIVNKLGLVKGDRVNLMLPRTSPQGKILSPRSVSFTLIGTFSFGGQIDHSKAFINLDAAREFSTISDGVTGVRFKFADVFESTTVIRDIGNSIDHRVYTSDWRRKYGHLYNDIILVKMITYLVLILVIGVASFNIVSTLVLAVQDKQGEIAILMTMGFSQNQVMKVFMVQGMLNAVLGCVLGALIGGLLSIYLSDVIAAFESLFGYTILAGDIYFIDFIPSELKVADLSLLVTATLVISFFATLYPARKATQIEPALILGQ